MPIHKSKQEDNKKIRDIRTTYNSIKNERTVSHLLFFVNYFRTPQNQNMLFWLLKDAQLTCKRRPFEVLLTPF